MISFKKEYFLVVMLMPLLFGQHSSFAQCTVDLGADTMICADPIFLDAGNGFDTYLWQDGSSNSTLTVTTPGLYSVTVETTGQTVVANGAFEAGNVGFISGYVYNATSLWNEGTYWVGNNANTVHSNFQGTDHTPPPGVNFLVVNGSQTAGLIVWGQSVTVTPNTNYKFSAWVCSVNGANPAQLRFSINNVLQGGGSFYAPPSVNLWVQFFIIWNSGLNTTANISIVNQNTGGGGNDFGLDDISFRPIIVCSDEIIISANDISASGTGIDVVCFGDATGGATSTVTGGYTPYNYHWSNNTTQPTLSNVFSGSYTLSVTDVTGCEATAGVTVNEPASVVSGSLAITPVSCFGGNDGAINLTPSGGNNPYTFHWNNGSTSEDISNLSANTYTVTITDNHGCKAIEQVEVTQPNELIVTISGTDLSCHGDTNAFANTIVTGGIADYVYNWSTGAFTSGITNLAAGLYSVTVMDAKYCIATASVVFEEPNPIQMYTSSDQTICLSKEANIVGNSFGGTQPYIYHWTPGGYSDASIWVSPSESTEYCTYVVDANGCKSTTKCVTVFVNPALEFNLSLDKDTICKGDTVYISSEVSGGNGGPYFLELYNGPILYNPQMMIPNETKKYVVIASDGCGTPQRADTVLVTVFDAPLVSFRSNILKGCEPLKVEFDLNIITPGVKYFWDFDDSPVYNFSVEASPMHLFRDPGIYDVSLSIENEIGCKSSHTERNMITVYPKPRAIFSHDPEAALISDPRIYFLNESELAYMSLWNFGDGDSIIATQPGDHVYDKTGQFLVSLITESINGCRDTTYQWVTIDDINTFYAPNAIQPFSGFQDNQVFKPAILNLNPESYELFIYNRWGELIFKSDMYEEGWDGRVDGEVVKQSSYVWMVRYHDINDNSYQKTGTVTVIY